MPTLPNPGDTGYPGHAFSVRSRIFLESAGGVPSEYVDKGDIIASDGRMWYHVTRSDSPGDNSFYANPMEIEIFRIAINDTMLTYGTTFTLTFDLWLQLYKQTCNVQYTLVAELGELIPATVPSPTGPNLMEIDWNRVALFRQRVLVTEILTKHAMGVQVIRTADGTLKTNKKLYGYVAAGDIIPTTPNFALRVRLVEFDTEDNDDGQSGIIYYSLEKATADVK